MRRWVYRRLRYSSGSLIRVAVTVWGLLHRSAHGAEQRAVCRLLHRSAHGAEQRAVCRLLHRSAHGAEQRAVCRLCCRSTLRAFGSKRVPIGSVLEGVGSAGVRILCTAQTYLQWDSGRQPRTACWGVHGLIHII